MRFKIWLLETTKEEFFDLADLQRDKPEKAMLALQRFIGGGAMFVAVEHIGDLIHRMTEQTTFSNGGYTAVKEKVRRALNLLTNGYGFEREFEENINSSAKYFKVPEDEFRQKVYNLLEIYAKEHEQLPVYNRAQYTARLAAVSLGERKFAITTTAIKLLASHLTSVEEWTRFTHEGLIQ